jgi:SAM-dependent methyltransferase
VTSENPSYLDQLDFYDHVERGIIEPIVAWLCDGRALTVLDAGCGEGAPAMAFAEAGCSVTAVDVDSPSLETARHLLAATPFADRVKISEENILQLPFEDNQFDLVWCSYILHHIEDKLAAAREIRRVLKPGGRFAIREGGLPLQMLPFDLGLGEPGLQGRLHVADDKWFAAMVKDTMPDEVPFPYGWLKLLMDTDFSDLTAKTFTLDLLPPFDAAQSEFIVYRLRRVLERDQEAYGPFLSDEDCETLKQLLDPQSPHYILKRTDLHVRYGVCVYVGQKPG